MDYTRKASIQRKTLWQQIADVLREDIIRGKIKPGERIVEEDIAEKFLVSRGPVREVLRLIGEDGFVVYESHKGSTVKTISYEEMQEKYLVRSTLEVLAIRIIAGKLPEEIEREMDECLEQMEKAAKEKDVYHIMCYDEQFHSCIVRAAKCETLYKIWAMLRESNLCGYYTMGVESIIPFDVRRYNLEILLKGIKELPVEKTAKLTEEHYKIVPEVLDLFVTPLVSVFVTGYLTLSIVGPIFVWAENAILGAIQWMLTLPLGIGSLIMGGLYAPTVVTGIHQMYTAIDIGQLAKYGVTYWLPLASAANVAQGAAALAVGIKSKDKKIKSLALPSSLSAFMGITEPAIFGVNLRFFKPFIAGCIGGGCGALYASLVHLGAKGTGVTAIFGILLCLNQPLQYLIEMVIAVGVAFVISFLIYKDAEPKAATETAAVENIETADAVTTDATTADTTAEIAEETLTSPVNGTQIPLS